MIRLSVPDIADGDIAAVEAVLRSGWLVQGKTVVEFERRVADRAGTEHAVAVSSGTAALHLALMVTGARAGTSVVVSAFSWPATANAAVLCGAEPVFVDIEPDTMCMSPAALEAVLQSHDNVAAVLPVHAFGAGADIDAITRIAGTFGVPVVEDAACALGTSCAGRPAGSWGLAAAFSFHPRKIVTTGEGGVVTTDDAELARRVRVLRNHGLDPASGTAEFQAAGFNYRMSEIHAALGLGQLERLDASLARRRALAARYGELFHGTAITTPAGPGHVYQAYVVQLPAAAAAARASIIASLRGRGIEAAIGTHHIPLTHYYRERFGFKSGDFRITDEVAARALALPLHGALSDADLAMVAEALLECLGALPTGAEV